MSTHNGKAPESHPIHEMMSRTGSFPVEVAYRFIKEYCHSPSIILDPFCGKGTTLLAARMLGHHAYGLDIAPEAVVCSSAKLTHVTINSFRMYLSNIRLGNPSLHDVPKSVKTFFHSSTLVQILSLRNRFQRDLDSDLKSTRSHAMFGLGCLLGILHGHASYSLSVPSSHAFSMAPGYVARFAKEHRLTKPQQDVKSCLLKKATSLLRVPLPRLVPGAVQVGCARSIAATFPSLVGRVDLILTSPPYLSAQTYSKDNWLRLWLLGYDHRTLKAGYIETGSTKMYHDLMEDVLHECETMLVPGGHLICVAGDVRLKTSTNKGTEPATFKTGSQLAKIVSTSVPSLSVIARGRHTVKSSSRYFHSLSKSNGHAKRAITERYFIAKKAEE